jgi:hypothetical protein
VLLGIAAIGIGAVAAVGSAGPFGFALVIPALFGLLGLLPLIAALGMRVFGRRHRRTGSIAAGAAATLVVALVALPVGDIVRTRMDDRRADAIRRRLEVTARSCARGADFAQCLRTAEPTVGCTPSGCFTTLVQLSHTRRRTVIIDLQGNARLLSDEG